uniref:C2H2-type domain-containing protein n=1 Tax=Physcomitrium patens TaxID=3218 RepID=A0A7I4EZI7_PHYPA
MLSRVTAHDHDKYHLRGNLEAPKSSKFSGDQMDREMLLTEDSRLDGYNAVTSSGYPENQRKGIIRIDSQRLSAEDGEMNTIEDGNSSGHLSSSSKGSPNSNLSEIEQRDCEIKRSKQAKGKICSEAEKELSSQPSAKVVNTKVTDSPPLEGLQGMRSDRKVHEPLNTFIRQTVDREPNLSLSSTSGDQPPQRLAEHLATNKYVKSLKVDFENLEENAIVNSYQVDIEIDTSGTNGGGDLPHRNLQTVKNTVPQTLAAFSAGVAKNPGKQNLGTDSPGCSLLPPSKVQLQKCEKCSREFFSPFNHRRHTRTHRRISQIEKEDLTVKRKNVAAFWDKVYFIILLAKFSQIFLIECYHFTNTFHLNQMEAYQIFASTREFVSERSPMQQPILDPCLINMKPKVFVKTKMNRTILALPSMQDLSGEAVMSNLIALKRQNNLTTLPPAYLKAGQDLLDMLNNEKSDELPLFSSQVLSALDDASEKTFLCSQRDVSKIGIEEKNLVALLGFIVEQALVKAWMADKDAEALRIQQELVKEEEAAQRKRERNVAKKKKKKEKSRQKGLKDRKAGAIYLALSEENESGDDENPSEIVEEINSPTASSASVNSSGLENILVESFEMEVNRQVQNVDKRDHNVGCEDANLLKENGMHFMRVICREDAPDSVDEDQMPQSECDLVSNGEEGERCSNFPTSSQVKEEGEGGVSGTSEQVRSAVASRKRSQLRPYKDPLRVGYQDSYRRGSWVCDSRFQEGAQQSSYRTSRKSLIGSPFTSNNER